MAEYLVTLRATVPTLFGLSSQSREEAVVFNADNAQEAAEKAGTYWKTELRKRGITEYDLNENSVTVNVVDVKKI